LDTSVRQRLETVVGEHASTVIIQEAIGEILYTARTREVVIALRDGARIAYTLPVPNRGGVRSGHKPMTGRVPRISRLMALAIKIETSTQEGVVRDYAEVAASGGVSRPRMSQIMSLTNLAPDIQETLLFLPKTMAGPDPITERQLRLIAQTIDWSRQKELFRELTGQRMPTLRCLTA
jgi:hypothetical protein